jgi:hypothetical protein
VRDSVRDRIESSDLSVPCRGAVAAVAPALDIEEANLTLRYLVPHKMETRLTKPGYTIAGALRTVPREARVPFRLISRSSYWGFLPKRQQWPFLPT